jgi:hypothetical protein
VINEAFTHARPSTLATESVTNRRHEPPVGRVQAAGDGLDDGQRHHWWAGWDLLSGPSRNGIRAASGPALVGAVDRFQLFGDVVPAQLPRRPARTACALLLLVHLDTNLESAPAASAERGARRPCGATRHPPAELGFARPARQAPLDGLGVDVQAGQVGQQTPYGGERQDSRR